MKNHAIIAALLLTLPAATSLANLLGGDDFNDNSKDLTKWGPDGGGGGHIFSEINQQLEYTADGSNSSVERPWILNAGSYLENWQISMDVHLANAPMPLNGDDRRLAFSVNAGGYSAELQLELKNYSDLVRRTFKATDSGPGGADVLIDTLSTDGALRLTFDATTKVLGFHYDENGSIGGYTWTQFYTTDVDATGTDWALNSGSTFAISIFGESQGVGVAAGEAYVDNFNTVPEPSSLLFALSGSVMLAFRRRKHIA